MHHRAIATLGATLGLHLGLSKDRVETLAPIVVAIVSARAVNLSRLAAERPGAPPRRAISSGATPASIGAGGARC